jgi:hypothetical protein
MFMVQIENLPLVLTGLGLTASILYYTMVLRSQNRTRQAQLYMQIWNRFSSEEGQRRALDVVSQEWTDFDDFREKHIFGDLEGRAKRGHIWEEHDGIGFLLHKGFIDIDMLNQLCGSPTILMWEKWEPIIREYRKMCGYYTPNAYRWWEYLYNRIVDYRKRHPEL